MLVRFTQDCAVHLVGQYRVEDFKKGQEIDGALAEYLYRSGCPVEIVDGEPLPGPVVDEPSVPDVPVDVDGDGVPDGTAKVVLEWVGDDKDRAALALQVEQDKGDDARSTLVDKLSKIAA